jgi:hypothetical protein
VSTAVRNDTPDSVLAERIGDPTKSPWSNVESLLAAVVDEVRNLQWMYASAHSDKKPARPEQIPRPGVKARGRRSQMAIADAKALDPRLRGLSDEEAEARLRELTGRG